jgi:NAD(P)-dependent dehydrogenase (short-subunit alcohol dehydrogenase family)
MRRKEQDGATALFFSWKNEMGYNHPMIILTGSIKRQALTGHVIIVTGAGGGIGFEAARALAALGAHVVIAEINTRTVKTAGEALAKEFGKEAVSAYHCDIGAEQDVARLAKAVLRARGRVDGVINNATVASIGAVQTVPLRDWDLSYRVNLRGPVLMAQAFLPGMIERGRGVFMCVSSVAQAYMTAYESLKAAQVLLGNTLSAELEGTGVSAFTIGPGTVPTETLKQALPKLAGLYGKTADEFNQLLKSSTLSVEAAGAGFAAAYVNAERYRGSEISSTQALIDAGMDIPDSGPALPEVALDAQQMERVQELAPRVLATLEDEARGYKQRSVFEQQWVYRTFRQRTGLPVEECLVSLERLARAAAACDRAGLALARAPLRGLAAYYTYLADMARGYVKDPVTREKQVAIVTGWQQDAQALADLLQQSAHD